MTIPELKVGQRFLVKSGTEIIEYSVQEITADGKYHRISPATGPCSQWVELWTLDIIHVFEAPNGYLMPQEHGIPSKPVTVMGLDPAWNKGDKTMIVSAEVMEDGIKVTDIRESKETYLRLQGTISATPIHPDIEGKPPIDPELLKPAE